MSRVDFYIIEGTHKQREQVLCRIAEKAYKKGCRFYVQVDDVQQAEQLDDLLWTFRQGSFLPHAVFTGNVQGEAREPLLIGSVSGPASHTEVLFNMGEQIPTDYLRYQRVIEVIDDACKQSGRKRYQHYKQDNCQIDTHKI